MQVIGIGNAIVDVICKVTDEFLIDHALIKSTMKLVDENEFKKILSNLKIENTVSGGSVANSIVGLSQLGNDVGFIGKVNNDDLGRSYVEGLKREKVKYCNEVKDEPIHTGTCLILITPDHERTMVTYLGIAGKISDKDIDEQLVREANLTFLEGYLWDEGEPLKAFEKALKHSNEVAMSLSDKFCVDRHKKSFLLLVKDHLDITFANEQEICSLFGTEDFNQVIRYAKDTGKLIVITRSDKGSVAVEGGQVYECKAQENLNIVDVTGAGDLFAAGFLHGYINQKRIEICLEQVTEMASKIIQKIGARLN